MDLGAWGSEGFLLGLSAGPYCLAVCAPTAVPCLLTLRPGWKGGALLLAEFLAGRLAAYVLFGLLAGSAGSALQGRTPVWLGPGALAFSGVLLLAVALFGAGSAPRACAPAPRRTWLERVPFLLGLTAGISPCPPFLAGLVRAGASASAWTGAVYFIGFFAGTALPLLALLAAAPFSALERARSLGRIACVLSGLWLLARGVLGFPR